MIAATAGHIDHGKTRLIRALTGIDTDRLPEEKARGISIDLGFAYWAAPGGRIVGFIDVPGHDKFVRNMVAGVVAVDFVLLVIAADDGVMPQTIEHLRIVELLGVRRGAIAVTKIDRVDAERRDTVLRDVSTQLSGTSLAESAVIPVSSVTGEGLPDLRDALVRAAGEVDSRRAEQTRHFRYAVDRAFSVKGSGTVVTGTTFSGMVRVGDHVMISPVGDVARVRGIQIQGRNVERAAAGARCALNLSGVPVERTGRGQWVIAPFLHAPTQRVDVSLQVLASESRPLSHWTPVLLHHGTASVLARVAVTRSTPIEPGSTAIVQLRTEQPIAPVHGDRFIIRDVSATRTLGGGLVADPAPPHKARMSPQRADLKAAWQEVDDAEVIAKLLTCSPLGIDLERCCRGLNLTTESMARVVEAAGGIVLKRARSLGITRQAIAALRLRTLEVLDQQRRSQSREPVITIDALRRIVASGVDEEAYASLLRGWADQEDLVLLGGGVRVASAEERRDCKEDSLWADLSLQLLRSHLDAPTVAELSRAMSIPSTALLVVLHRRAKDRQVIAVTPQRFYLRSTLLTLAAVAQALAKSRADGLFTAADFRDSAGIGRNLGIEILECFDRHGVTRRIGNARRILCDPAKALAPTSHCRDVPPALDRVP